MATVENVSYVYERTPDGSVQYGSNRVTTEILATVPLPCCCCAPCCATEDCACGCDCRRPHCCRQICRCSPCDCRCERQCGE